MKKRFFLINTIILITLFINAGAIAQNNFSIGGQVLDQESNDPIAGATLFISDLEKGTAADNARLKLFPRFARYSGEQATEATKRYLDIAESNNISLAQMALAFVNQQPFVTSNIIGATSLEQLEENVDSINIDLSAEVLAAINAVHAEIPNPAP